MDETEDVRRVMVQEINQRPKTKEELQEMHGEVWGSMDLAQHFEVLQFSAPLVVVRRKSDNKRGSLFFQANPRFYFGFQEDSKSC